MHFAASYWQLSATHGDSPAINGLSNPRPYDGQVPCKASNRAEEISKENHNSVELHQKANQRPTQQDQRETGKKGACPFELLPPREEGCRLLGTDDDGESDEEENLWCVVGMRLR